MNKYFEIRNHLKLRVDRTTNTKEIKTNILSIKIKIFN